MPKVNKVLLVLYGLFLMSDSVAFYSHCIYGPKRMESTRAGQEITTRFFLYKQHFISNASFRFNEILSNC